MLEHWAPHSEDFSGLVLNVAVIVVGPGPEVQRSVKIDQHNQWLVEP